MIKILLVGCGGFVGSVSRYLLSGFVHKFSGGHAFPFGTLSVNILGCFGIGLLAGVADARNVLSEEFRLLLLVGVLGGFTTFSSFGHETIVLFRNAMGVYAVINVVAQIVLCLGFAWLGHHLSRGF